MGDTERGPQRQWPANTVTASLAETTVDFLADGESCKLIGLSMNYQIVHPLNSLNHKVMGILVLLGASGFSGYNFHKI